MEKTNSIERNTDSGRPQAVSSEQNRKHVTELICSQEGNPGSSCSPREMKTGQQYLSVLAAVRSCRGHKHFIANVITIVKMLLGCFDYIVIFLCKISTNLSGFGFFLCRKKQRLKGSIVSTAKHVQYKQHNLSGRFLCPFYKL